MKLLLWTCEVCDIITLLDRKYFFYVDVHSVSVLSTPYTHVGENFVLLLPKYVFA